MALIENAKGRSKKQTPSGYTRLFGIDALGTLMSRVQGAVISAGTELEKLIWERAQQVKDLDEFIEDKSSNKTGLWVASKKQVKKSNLISSRYEPDFLGFDVVNRTCYIIEVKDGDQFDTKKASGEHQTMHAFANDISSAIPYKTKIYLCSFNASTKQEIYDGLKRKFAIDELLTGKDLCVLLGINYYDVLAVRNRDHKQNLDYFLSQLLEIPLVRSAISSVLGTKPK